MKKYSFAPLCALLIAIGGLHATTANAFALHNYQTGLCLGIGNDDPTPGTPVVTWDCHTVSSQDWLQYFATFNSSTYSWEYQLNLTPSWNSWLSSYINSVFASSLRTMKTVLDLKSGSLQNGTPVVSGVIRDGDAKQQWWAADAFHLVDGTRCFYIENSAGDYNRLHMVMGVLGGNPRRGGQVVIWQLFTDANGNLDYVHHPDQYWCMY